MRSDGSLPSYDKLFGDPDLRPADESRSVYSPAAYLADLIQLADDCAADGAPGGLAERRPDLVAIPLDGSHSFTELPYLDIVNEVLAGRVSGGDADVYEVLAGLRYPFLAPFSLGHERVRQYLRHLDVDPVEVYRRFTPSPDADVVAREYLGLTMADVAMLTTVLDDGADLRACYRLDDTADAFASLAGVDEFRHATGLTGDELRELLSGGLGAAERAAAGTFFVHQGHVVALDADELRLVQGAEPIAAGWFDRVNRFVRLARRVQMSFTDLDLVLRTCCGNRIDLAALRTVAVVSSLQRALDLPVDVVVSLVAPMETTGVGDLEPRDLFNRVFNVPFVTAEGSVLHGPGQLPADYAARPELRCTGDLLSAANAQYRRRVATALGLADSDLAAVVTRYRERRTAGLFTRMDTGLAELSLLHRVARLTAALSVPVTELFGLLDALARDPSIQRHSTFPVLIDTGGNGADPDQMIAGGDVGAGLWLVQTLTAVVRWTQATGLTAADLAVTQGADDAADLATLDRLRAAFTVIEPDAWAFRSDRFGDRAAQVIHDVAAAAASDGSGRSGRLLRLDADRATGTAHDALAELAVVAGNDFLGIGLGERLAAKLFTNLMFAGYVATGGTVVPERVPAAAKDLRLGGDFSAQRETLFKMLGGLDACYRSDLVALADLSGTEQAELYDNLVFNGYLAPDGAIWRPGFFADPANVAAFTADADLGHRADLAEDVHRLLLDRLDRFTADRPVLDPDIFAALPLGDRERAGIVDSLRLNGHLDGNDRYVAPDTLVALPLADLRLGVEFHPYRRRVLDAIQAQLAAARAEAYALTAGDLSDLADAATARRVADRLAEAHVRDGRITAETVALLADPSAVLSLDGFTDDENATIAYQLGVILADARPFRLDPAALGEVGFTVDERRRLLRQLIDAGHLTETLAVPAGRIEYFAYAPNAADYVLPGLADFSTDIFFLLHAVATELAGAAAEITAVLAGLAAQQRAVLIGTLRDELGTPTGTTEAICAAVAGGVEHAINLLVEPVLDDPEAAAADPDLRRALRRIRGFARFAATVGLDGDEVAVAFADQDLTGKFPEPLALPAGVDGIDALLTAGDGIVYLFRGADVWVYSADTQRLLEERPRSLAALSPVLGGLTSVDAAFTDVAGAEWIVGRDAGGAQLTFVREPGHPRWLRRAQEWGVVRNVFDEPARVEAAFTDGGGRTYLFHRDQYVRYSGDDHTHVDEGYPRRTGDWWETEQRTTPLPARFRESLDAAFHGRDDTTYLFSGDSFLAVRDSAVEQPVAGTWGRVVNVLGAGGPVDATYVDGPALYAFAGNQVTRYTDGTEHAGVRADDGYPRRIEAQLGDVPAEFEGGVEAAFADRAGSVHLFKDGRTVALHGGGRSSATATAQRWGRLEPALPGGTVDAAMIGLDGRTYLFSGDRYVRYSGADYSSVDVGYPRRITGDWGGMRRVDAAFVQDGATYLFGAAGLLFDVSAGSDPAELDAGRLPYGLRRRLLAHGVTATDDAVVTGQDPQWHLDADHGVGLVLRRAEQRLEVHCDPATEVAFHVRFSVQDHATADPGYPRPVSDNWWNLPEALVGPDAAFTQVDAVLTGRDNRTYLFSGDRFVVSDSRRRWWSEPQTLAEHWDSLPFDRVDAAFVGHDGRTYLFSGNRYVRYSTGDHTRVDDRYPATITPFWGNVLNTIARTGRVDAALVTDEHTYLFSGDQFVRYTRPAGDLPYYSDDPGLVDLGYPRRLSALAQEPRLRNLRGTLDSVTAAFADRGSVHLFSGTQCQVVSDSVYRRYDDLTAETPGCAFLDDGAVCVEHADGWHRYSALERATVTREPVRPRLLRGVARQLRTGLDAVLVGTDGNTYLFQGTTCHNVELGRDYPLAEEWGRPRNTVYHDNAVDAAFVGSDGSTYLFRGDQFVVYTGGDYLDAEVDGEPRPVAAHWAGLTGVCLAYVRDGVTYLFEPPDPTGTMRYLAYSGTRYDRPDEGYPRTADASFWGVPEQLRPDGFVAPQAVLFSGTSTLLLTGGTYLQHNDAAGTWSHARPLERIWRGIGATESLTTAFTGRDGATYFFFDGEFVRHDGRVAGAREPIRARWARTHNNFLAGTGDDVVDAAVVHRGVTYLFAGDQYVRYSDPDYRYADAGYPKTIVGNIRAEDAFAGLPAAVEDDLAERFAAGSRSMIDTAVADDRTVYLFVGRTCHAVSRELSAGYDPKLLGRVRNAVADRGRVDAALVDGERTYVFSGDQYVRYTGADYTRVDDGYPRTIAGSLPGELGVAALPEQFGDGIDAALRTGDGRVVLFTGDQYLSIVDGVVAVAPIRGAWGVVRNEFRAAGHGLDAAFATAAGEVYAFAGGQYARYSPGAPETVEDGYPRRIRDDWGDPPAAFEAGVDGAFRFAGRTYLARGGDYVRYSTGRFTAVDRTYPQPFRHRWADTADYRLSDLQTITRFATVSRTHRDADGGLATLLLPGRRVVADPYTYLAGLFGWDAEELRWCRRHSRMLAGTAAGKPDGADDRLELEFLLALVDLFTLTDRLGTGPSQLHAGVWSRLHAVTADPHAAADTLHGLLARRAPQQWPVLARQLHDELNVRKRDALVATVLATDGGTARDLFERFLIDVDMGAAGTTSRVREAIAAAQLYLHRYLLNLELPGHDEHRERVKTWWRWMRNYRVWEANRKVFLYPENYLRPELRLTKTPAFRSLEGDLLQGEITAEAVDRAYRRYLDEYTEVSRLTIAGGYVYTKDRLPDGPRRLVLFGRTRTDPRRYYHRRAEFANREKLAATWGPWQPVDLQIDADQVHPVHAFGRVFVFWTVPETVAEDAAGTAVLAQASGDRQVVSTRGRLQRIRICYSFQNLNQEWVPAQTLGTGTREPGTVSDATLLVMPRMKTAEQMSVVVSCTYAVTTPSTDPTATGPAGQPRRRRGAALFELNPELYAEDLLAAAGEHTAAVATDLEVARARAATAEHVARIFVDPVDPTDVVRFDAPPGSEFWFSVDHKGGSFLCRPVQVTGTDGTAVPLARNRDRLPEWSTVDAAVELPDGTRYFFDNTLHQYLQVKPKGKLGAPEPTGPRWGQVRTVLGEAGPVDAVLVRGEHTFVVSGRRYVRFTGTPFVTADAGYPKDLAGNDDGLPRWTSLGAAFTGPDGAEYFLDGTGGRYVTGKDLEHPHPIAEFWTRHGAPDGFSTVDAAVVTGTATFLVSKDRYVRYSHRPAPRRSRAAGAPDPVTAPDAGYPRPLAGNLDGLPTDFPAASGVSRQGTMYWFDNAGHRYHEVAPDGTRTTRPTHATSVLATTGTVDAAWVRSGRLYLTSGREYVRYTLGPDGAPAALADDGFPKALPAPIDAAFRRDDGVYLFSGDRYTRLHADQEPTELAQLRPIAGAWGELPRTGAPPFDAALDSESGLYLFTGDSYVLFSKTAPVRRPYELATLPFEIIRLTTGTASALNRRLLSGGVPALLDLSTQETDELALTTDPGATTGIRVRPGMVDAGRLPTGSHLDFRSANGLYYWEIFFHAPFLIAQALNGAQRFEDARRWYEYVFDPTDPASYWRFLPFLAIDLRALAGALAADLARLNEVDLPAEGTAAALAPILTALQVLTPAALQQRDPRTEQERAALLTATAPATHQAVGAALAELSARPDLTAAQRDAVDALRERSLTAADLAKQFDALGDRDALLAAYRDNPFDPHTIADLRPVAYRRAVVMGYIDNLLDWGDMLFRQYTPDSVDEARLLYVLAHDLLGERPERLGTRLLPPAGSFADLDAAPGELDLLGHLTGGGTLVAGGGEVHAGVADDYFHIPGNDVFDGYADRVQDRLRKIRASLTLMGISQPLPLFEPALDPMALVRSVAAGGTPELVAAGTAVAVPQYRFAFVFRRAQDLTDKLRQLGADLLGVLERGDAEELSRLQARQEREILTLTRAVKDAQVRAAEEYLAELTESQAAARARANAFQTRLANGMNALERAQVELLSSAAGAHLASGVLKVAAGIAFAVPQFYAGPFIIGTDTGGRQLGSSLDQAAQVAESLGEGLSMIGEAVGVQAQYARMAEDWQLELATAQSDVLQLEHRIAGAAHQITVARQEAEILDRQIAHNDSVATFLKDKFTNAELYGWMSGTLAALYFQAFHLAHDMARAAERALQFEQGRTADSAGTFIRPVYWDSRRNGLLAGDSLWLDLERLGRTCLDDRGRGLEITRQVSLRDLDPVALLGLRDTGSCEFALSEALFDHDFPGHYRRQIRTVTVTFLGGDGNPLAVNATLTQLGHKVVLEPDPQAVRYLLDPQGSVPAAVRSDWRGAQQIALSQPDGGRENNGLFELRFDDDRYLPFEGTGAVSRWRMQRTGRAVPGLYDVVVAVKYTAEPGGEIFANAVRGLLKPYPAARLFDLARDFPHEWQEFLGGDRRTLVLPFTTDMFPDVAGLRISGIYPTYELADGAVTRLVLDGDPAMTLSEAKLLPTPGKTLRPDGPSPWLFTVDGPKEHLRNVGLVLTYQARVQ
jgi:hypothetical protein